MRKKIAITLFSLLINSSLFCQDVIMPDNLKNIIKEDFSGERSIFPILTSIDNYFIIDNGDYLLSRNNTETEYAILTSTKELVSDFILRSSIKLGPSSNKRSSAGLILKAQSNGSAAIVFEINRKGEFRIKELLNNNTYKYLSGKSNNEGWVKNRNIKREDEYNSIEVRCVSNVFDIYINNSFLTTVFSPSLQDGKMGIMIGKDAKARISHYYLDIPSEIRNNLIEQQKENNTLTSLTDEVKELESANLSLINSNERLQNDLQASRNSSKKLDKLYIRIDSLNKKLSDLNSNIESTKNLLDKERESHDNVKLLLEKSKKENRSLGSQLSSSQVELEKKEKDVNSLKEKNNKLSDEVKSKNAEISSINSKIKSQEKSQNTLSNTIKDLKNKVAELKSNLSTQKSNSNNEISNLNKTISNKSSDISSLNTKLSSIQKELNTFKKKYPNIEKLGDKNIRLTKNLSEAKKDISSLGLQVQTLENQLKILNSENNLLTESKNQQNEEIELLTSTVDELYAKVKKMKEVLIYKGFDEQGIDVDKVRANNQIDQKNNIKSNKNNHKAYSVQIATYGNKVAIAQFKGLLDVFYYNSGNGTFLYMSGKFNNSDDAIEHKNKLINMGYENAFVVELKNK